MLYSPCDTPKDAGMGSSVKTLTMTSAETVSVFSETSESMMDIWRKRPEGKEGSVSWALFQRIREKVKNQEFLAF
jgi:hypothetical protein